MSSYHFDDYFITIYVIVYEIHRTITAKVVKLTVGVQSHVFDLTWNVI